MRAPVQVVDTPVGNQESRTSLAIDLHGFDLKREDLAPREMEDRVIDQPRLFLGTAEVHMFLAISAGLDIPGGARMTEIKTGTRSLLGGARQGQSQRENQDSDQTCAQLHGSNLHPMNHRIASFMDEMSMPPL